MGGNVASYPSYSQLPSVTLRNDPQLPRDRLKILPRDRLKIIWIWPDREKKPTGGDGLMGVAVREGKGWLCTWSPGRGSKDSDWPEDASPEKYGRTLPGLIRLGMVSSVHFKSHASACFGAIGERKTCH